MLIRVILGGCLGDRRVNLKWLEFNLFSTANSGKRQKEVTASPTSNVNWYTSHVPLQSREHFHQGSHSGHNEGEANHSSSHIPR